MKASDAPRPSRGRRPRSAAALLVSAALVVAAALAVAVASREGQDATARGQPVAPVATPSPTVAPTPARAAIGGRAQPSGKLLYVKAGNVWRWDGGRSAQVTRGLRYQSPAWAPDGRSFVASEVGDNHSDLVVFAESGAPTRRLTTNWSHVSVQESSWGRTPAWSPDGTRIAYASDQVGFDMSLWLIPSAGGQPRRHYATPYGGGGLDHPTWSPDGQRLAFSMMWGPYQDATTDIFVMPLATGAAQRITTFADGAYDAAWSPSGDYLAFAGRREGRTAIYLVRPDGSGLVQITDGGGERGPAWSPDGGHLAYLALRGAALNLEVVRIDTASRVIVSSPVALVTGEDLDAISGASWAR